MAWWLRRKYEAVPRDRRGFLIVAVGIMLFSCFLAGLTIDVGHVYLVKGELQNAADATALAGAGNLYSDPPIPTRQTPVGVSEASAFIGQSKADGLALTDCQVEGGFWDITKPPPQTLQSSVVGTGICSNSTNLCNENGDCAGGGCLQIMVPAVQVTVSKSPDNNGGPVKTIFASVVGWGGFEPGATAKAISGPPGSVPPGILFPFVISRCQKESYLNGEISGEQTLQGHWSILSANLSSNPNDNTMTVTQYINSLSGGNGNNTSGPPAVSVKDSVSVVDATNSSSITAAQGLIAAGRNLLLMPVVGCTISPGTTAVVTGFVGVRLINVFPSSGILSGSFENYPLPSGAGPGGETTNMVTLPQLVE